MQQNVKLMLPKLFNVVNKMKSKVVYENIVAHKGILKHNKNKKRERANASKL